MSERWCEHITKFEFNNWWCYGKGVLSLNGKPTIDVSWVHDEEKACCLCGAPRPEPKKGLAEKLRDQFRKPNSKKAGESEIVASWEAVATCALEHFVAVVNSVDPVEVFRDGDKYISIRPLLRAMEASLNG